MDIESNKDDKEKKDNSQDLTPNNTAKVTDSVSICMEDIDEKIIIVNDQLNENILKPPYLKAEKLTKKQEYRRRNTSGNFKSKNGEKSRSVWVQFMLGRAVPSEGAHFDYEPETRNNFVRKVFVILTVMLLLTFAIVFGLSISPFKGIFIKYGLFIMIPAMILLMSVSYAFACSQCSRNPPCNYVCLLLAVLAMSIVCCYITLRFDTAIIVFALLATVVVVFVCTCLALTNFDFTSWLLYVVVIMSAIAALGLILMIASLGFGFYMKPLHVAILIAGLIMNCVMLVIELQMVLGGKSVELSETDYALGAFMLYTSIIEIFLKFVQIFALLNED